MRKSTAVTIEQIRTLYDAQPFQPFIIHLADGREIPVDHREFMMRAPIGRTIAVYGRDDCAHVIDLLLVTDLRIKPAKNGSSKKRRRRANDREKRHAVANVTQEDESLAPRAVFPRLTKQGIGRP